MRAHGCQPSLPGLDLVAAVLREAAALVPECRLEHPDREFHGESGPRGALRRSPVSSHGEREDHSVHPEP